MDAGMKRLAVLVAPGLVRLVALAGEDGLAAPVLPLARQIVAPLEDQDALARWREPVGERAASGTASDDDDIVTISAHDLPPWRTRSGRCNDVSCSDRAWRMAFGARVAREVRRRAA